MAGVILTLLGSPSASLADGTPVCALSGSKCLALLAYLALEPGPHTREELAALLWGESSDEAARASLRQALMRLRQLVGPVIVADHNTVRLAGPIACDAMEFLRLVETDLRAAVAFDVPRLLAGFSVRHAPAFDEWVAAVRRRLLRRYQEALAALAREAMGQWRWRETVAWADRWLACDPLSDEAARLAIEALYLGGDRGAALTRYGEYRDRFVRETGCGPSRALVALIHRIEADAETVTPRPISDEWYARAPTFEASLVGREAQWARLRDLWRRVRRGAGAIALVEGEAGIGKSRLAEEFLRWALTAGGTILRGHAYDARTGVPYAPVVEALREAIDAPGVAGTAPEWLTEAARLAPELRQRFPALPEPTTPADPADAWRTFEAVAQILLALAAERPVVVSVDDLHWADADSCTLLHYLVRRLEPAPVLWLATLTPGELERDAPAARLHRVLRAKPHAAVIPVGPLSEHEVWRLIRELGHVSAPTGGQRFASRIYDITRGNPFYILELLKTLFAQGLLATTAETAEWTVDSAAVAGLGRELPMSRTVRDTIAERVGRLPEQLRDVLVTIAVARTGCRIELLSHIHGISRLHAAAVGDALVDRRLAIEDGGVYRCAHPVIARVVQAMLTSSRRREVHRALALALALVAGDDPAVVAGEIARHADRGGEPALAYRHALLASDAALARYAFEEALAWLDLAAAAADTRAETDAVNRRTADLLEVAGWREPPRRPSIGTEPDLERDDLDLRVAASGGDLTPH